MCRIQMAGLGTRTAVDLPFPTLLHSQAFLFLFLCISRHFLSFLPCFSLSPHLQAWTALARRTPSLPPVWVGIA